MNLSFEEVFSSESSELTEFCKNNNLVQYHSGGGNFHYALNSEPYPWLFNLNDFEGLPTNPNDVCSGGLYLGDVIDIFIETNDVDEGGEMLDRVFAHLSQLDLKDVEVDNDNVLIGKQRLIDILPIVEIVNTELTKFLKQS